MQLNGTTLRAILERHPEWMDLEIACYGGGNGDYVSGLIYAADEHEDVPGADARPTGRTLLVVSVD